MFSPWLHDDIKLMLVTKGDWDGGFHGYPVTLVRNSRVITWLESRKLQEERGKCTRLNRRKGEMRKRERIREKATEGEWKKATSIAIMQKCVWLSHCNILEKQLLSTEGMENRESWEMMNSLKCLSHRQSCSN